LYNSRTPGFKPVFTLSGLKTLCPIITQTTDAMNNPFETITPAR
jgi:hypothetical protein